MKYITFFVTALLFCVSASATKHISLISGDAWRAVESDVEIAKEILLAYYLYRKDQGWVYSLVVECEHGEIEGNWFVGCHGVGSLGRAKTGGYLIGKDGPLILVAPINGTAIGHLNGANAIQYGDNEILIAVHRGVDVDIPQVIRELRGE